MILYFLLFPSKSKEGARADAIAKDMPSLKDFIKSIFSPHHPERRLLLAVALSAFALWAFIEIAEEMVEGESQAYDTWILMALRNPVNPALPLGPTWLHEVMRDITALGSTSVLSIVTVATIGFLGLSESWRSALLVLVSIVGGVLLSFLLKVGFDRPRPDLMLHSVPVYTASFPSGHAMMSAVVYLTLGALLAATQRDDRLKIYILGLALTLTLLVGGSRVYLGVHWPTDVLAGWALGASWAIACWLVWTWLRARGRA